MACRTYGVRDDVEAPLVNRHWPLLPLTPRGAQEDAEFLKPNLPCGSPETRSAAGIGNVAFAPDPVSDDCVLG